MHANDRWLHFILLRKTVPVAAWIHTLVVHPDFAGCSARIPLDRRWLAVPSGLVLLPAVYLLQIPAVVGLSPLHLGLLCSLPIYNLLPRKPDADHVALRKLWQPQVRQEVLWRLIQLVDPLDRETLVGLVLLYDLKLPLGHESLILDLAEAFLNGDSQRLPNRAMLLARERCMGVRVDVDVVP